MVYYTLISQVLQNCFGLSDLFSSVISLERTMTCKLQPAAVFLQWQVWKMGILLNCNKSS